MHRHCINAVISSHSVGVSRSFTPKVPHIAPFKDNAWKVFLIFCCSSAIPGFRNTRMNYAPFLSISFMTEMKVACQLSLCMHTVINFRLTKLSVYTLHWHCQLPQLLLSSCHISSSSSPSVAVPWDSAFCYRVKCGLSDLFASGYCVRVYILCVPQASVRLMRQCVLFLENFPF